jgi:serine O-acetyltransferase
MSRSYTKDTGSYSLLELLRLDILRVYRLTNGVDLSSPGCFRLWFSLLSPFMVPVLFYRLSHFFRLRKMRFIAKLFGCLNSILFGIEIASSCSIGPGFFIPHPQGTVIGAWSVGANATIFQGVTLGTKHLAFDFDKSSRPVLGDNITICAGAKVLGGISIGSNSVVGANSVVISDVPPDCVAVGVPAKIKNVAYYS